MRERCYETSVAFIIHPLDPRDRERAALISYLFFLGIKIWILFFFLLFTFFSLFSLTHWLWDIPSIKSIYLFIYFFIMSHFYGHHIWCFSPQIFLNDSKRITNRCITRSLLRDMAHAIWLGNKWMCCLSDFAALHITDWSAIAIAYLLAWDTIRTLGVYRRRANQISSQTNKVSRLLFKHFQICFRLFLILHN